MFLLHGFVVFLRCVYMVFVAYIILIRNIFRIRI